MRDDHEVSQKGWDLGKGTVYTVPSEEEMERAMDESLARMTAWQNRHG